MLVSKAEKTEINHFIDEIRIEARGILRGEDPKAAASLILTWLDQVEGQFTPTTEDS